VELQPLSFTLPNSASFDDDPQAAARLTTTIPNASERKANTVYCLDAAPRNVRILSKLGEEREPIGEGDGAYFLT
jgi:hypothetical protein